jgi:hypothetical protein
MITVTYSSIDGVRKRRKFKTLAGARKFATHWVGDNPDLGSSYAVSFDGVGKITVDGVPLKKLFSKDDERPDGRFWLVVTRDGHSGGTWYATLEAAEAEARAKNADGEACHVEAWDYDENGDPVPVPLPAKLRPLRTIEEDEVPF